MSMVLALLEVTAPGLERLTRDPDLLLAALELAGECREAEEEPGEIEADELDPLPDADPGTGSPVRLLKPAGELPPNVIPLPFLRRPSIPAPVPFPAPEPPPEDGPVIGSVDLDKAWHGIHWLLTGSVWEGAPPLDFLVRGGREMGEDLGYGPPRAMGPEEVRRVATALDSVPPERLAERYDPDRMTAGQVYPNHWVPVEEDPEVLGWLLSGYDELRTFLRRAARHGSGVVLVMT